MRYAEDNNLSIDNSLSEPFRCVEVGRKNCIYASSNEGEKTAAVLISLIATGKELGDDPYRSHRDTLTCLSQQATLDDAMLDAS